MTKKDFNLTALEDVFMVKNSGLAVRRQGLYPSEASVQYELDGRTVTCGKCIRACFYRASKTKQTNPGGAKLNITGNLGKWDEQGLIDMWKKMGLWVDNNIKFFDDSLYVSGELDAVLHPINQPNYRIGYEVKTHYGHFSNKHVKGSKGQKSKKSPTGYSETKPRIFGAPKFEQFLQAVFYSHFYVNEKKRLDEYRMYYLERGDGTRNEFAVGAELRPDGTHQCWYEQLEGKSWGAFKEGKVYTPYTIEDIKKRYKTLLKKLRDKELPGMDFMHTFDREYIDWAYKNNEITKSKVDDFEKGKKIGSWQCSYCSYKDKCLEDEELNANK